jgi:hypothetical protein
MAEQQEGHGGGMKILGTARKLRSVQLDAAHYVTEYVIDPPAECPNTGEFTEKCRVVHFPDLDSPRRIVQVNPVVREVEQPMFPWFQFSFTTDISDAEALERIGYRLVEVLDHVG